MQNTMLIFVQDAKNKVLFYLPDLSKQIILEQRKQDMFHNNSRINNNGENICPTLAMKDQADKI